MGDERPSDPKWLDELAEVFPKLGPDDRPPEEIALYLQAAGMCWCATWTKHIEMDTHIAEAFARMLRFCMEQKEAELAEARREEREQLAQRYEDAAPGVFVYCDDLVKAIRALPDAEPEAQKGERMSRSGYSDGLNEGPSV